MRIGIAQINATLLDFENNAQKIIQQINRAEEQYCDLVIFPEAALFGYHPFDLLEFKSLVLAQKKFIQKIQKKIPENMGVLFGVMSENSDKLGRPFYNSAIFLEKAKKPRIFHKELLPTGDVFDEARFIEHGLLKKNVFRWKGKKILVTICEDIWAWPNRQGRSHYRRNPLRDVRAEVGKLDLVLNLSASPFYPGKQRVRERLVAQTIKLFEAPMVYCNLVGAQDEIVFDGASFAIGKNQKKIAQLMPLEEDFGVLDLKKNEGMLREELFEENELIRRALVLGIRDFCRKVGLQRVHLGLSGGVDSALVACLAADAMGPQNVTGIALPSQYTSKASSHLAEQLAKNLGIHFSSVSIQASYRVAKKSLDEAFGIRKFSLVHENLQSRIRGMYLMAQSNNSNSLLLATSNKSEIAAGFSTLYGDQCGGLMPIGDLVKDQVYQLCDLYNRDVELIPRQILTRAPSAELRPNQKDSDRLPPYDQLDAAVRRLVVKSKITSEGVDQWLLPVLLKTEFKRWQAPPILKVSERSFGRGRRFPIAHQASKYL